MSSSKGLDPHMRYNELEDGRIKITFKIPNLEKSNNPHVPKNGSADCHFYQSGMSMLMECTVNKGKKQELFYQKNIRQFPSKVSKLEWSIVKEYIVVYLEKFDANISWKKAFEKNGLDQISSSESSESD